LRSVHDNIQDEKHSRFQSLQVAPQDNELGVAPRLGGPFTHSVAQPLKPGSFAEWGYSVVDGFENSLALGQDFLRRLKRLGGAQASAIVFPQALA
jgi:hypothetical protein